ncbi:MAG: hypothetical protein IAF38_19270, partial [Bacteroidia bacterium]|nr:hypothetical protein [Bacteroidia bacterium]
MVATIFIIISVFFLIGGIGVWRIGIKKPEEKQRIVLKYFTYAIIVYSLCSVFAFTSYYFLALTLIAVAGFFEIIYAWLCSDKKKPFILFFGIVTYLLVGFLFLSGAQKFPGDKLLPLYGLILCFDGFSQICGQLFGKRK